MFRHTINLVTASIMLAAIPSIQASHTPRHDSIAALSSPIAPISHRGRIDNIHAIASSRTIAAIDSISHASIKIEKPIITNPIIAG